DLTGRRPSPTTCPGGGAGDARPTRGHPTHRQETTMPDEDETIRPTADTRTTPEVCTRCHTAPVEHLGGAGLHGVCCATCVDIAIADGHTCPTCQGTAPMPDVVCALGLS